MATDLAIDYNTGDLLISPTHDFDLRTGVQTIEQQIRVRLRIIQGQWALDPTAGALGSRMREMFRLPVWRVITELPLVIHEALDQMAEIRVTDIDVQQDSKVKKQLNVVLRYVVKEEGEDENVDVQTLETTVLTEG